MHRLFSTLLFLVLVPLLTLGCGWHNKGKVLTPPTSPSVAAIKDAASAEEAVALLAEASKAKNADAYIAQLTKPYRDLKQSYDRTRQAEKTLIAALESKHGKNPEFVGRFMMWELSQLVPMYSIETLEILARQPQEDGSVLVRVKTTEHEFDKTIEVEERFNAVLEGAAWKLAPWARWRDTKPAAIDDKTEEKPKPEPEVKYKYMPPPESNLTNMFILEKEQGIYERHAREVEQGKFKNRQEAEDAIYDALDAVMKETSNGKPFLSRRPLTIQNP
jgi:hypothetical protein